MKSFLSARARIATPDHSAHATAPSSPFAKHGASTTGAGGAAGKTRHTTTGAHVECVREGDRVVRLVVTCACGEEIEIDCLYSDGRA